MRQPILFGSLTKQPVVKPLLIHLLVMLKVSVPTTLILLFKTLPDKL